MVLSLPRGLMPSEAHPPPTVWYGLMQSHGAKNTSPSGPTFRQEWMCLNQPDSEERGLLSHGTVSKGSKQKATLPTQNPRQLFHTSNRQQDWQEQCNALRVHTVQGGGSHDAARPSLHCGSQSSCLPGSSLPCNPVARSATALSSPKVPS